jgi:predicted RNA-binding Zn ribbon-like protein
LQVVEEYESDDLASGSEDEKRLKKAKEAANRKRQQKISRQATNNPNKVFTALRAFDHQLFRGKYFKSTSTV